MTIIHIGIDYKKTIEEVNVELNTMADVYRSGVSEAMWTYNYKQLKSICTGLLKDPAIARVKVYDTLGETLFHYHRDRSKIIETQDTHLAPEDKVMNIISLNPNIFTVDYLQDQKTIQLGKVELYPSEDVVYQKMEHTVYLIVINAIIKTMAFWILFYLLSYKILRRPLEIMTRELEELDPQLTSAHKIDMFVKRPNELKILETTYNHLLENLCQARLVILERDQLLKQQNLELEKKVERRTREIQSTVLLKDALLKTLCHDLSNPLKGIVSWIRMIRSGNQKDQKDEREMIYDSLESCWSILLGVNKMRRSIKTEDMDVKHHSLADLIDQSLLPLQADLMNKKIVIHKDIKNSAQILVDQNYFSFSILCNLFHNAIKFSPMAGIIHVRCFLEGKKLILEIEDHGKGLGGKNYSAEDMLAGSFPKSHTEEHHREGVGEGSGTGLQQVAFFAALFHFNVELISLPQQKGAMARLITTTFKPKS